MTPTRCRASAALLLLLLATCARRDLAPLAPDGVAVVSRANWRAAPAVPPVRAHVPTRITIHHTATLRRPERPVGDKLRALQQWSQRDDSLSDGRRKPAWPDVPYHLYVAADGSVGEGREWRWVGDSNTPYDPTGHFLVVVEGSFNREEPSAEQVVALEAVVRAAARRWRIPPEGIAAHRDFASTSCPGDHLYALLPRLRDLVARDTT
jgi:hypothetical protein